MKVILTIGIVLGLLITSASAQEQVIPAERLEEAFVLTPEEQEKNLEICTQNLIKLGKSIEAYLEVNGDYPGMALRSLPSKIFTGSRRADLSFR